VAPIIARSPLVPAAYNRVFNIGADTPYTILQLAEEIAMVFDKPVQLKHFPPRNEVVHAFSDHSRVRDVFRPPSPIDLRTGIRRMAAWVKSRGPAVPVRFSAIEVRDKLPEAWNS
jgi:UDP-glucose 4-epimerase